MAALTVLGFGGFWANHAAADGSLCILLDSTSACEKESSEKKKKRADGVVDKQAMPKGGPSNAGKGKGQTPGVGFQSSVSEDYSVYSLPLSFPLFGPIGVDMSVPVIQTDEDTYVGHGRFSLTYTLQPLDVLALMLYAGARVRTGDEETAGPLPSPWPTLAISAALDFSLFRFFGSVESVTRPEQDLDYDPGDTTSTLVGIDAPFFFSSIWLGYLGWYQTNTEADVFGSDTLNNALVTGDALLGAIYRPWGIRIGISYPAKTEAEDPEDEERESSVDFGFRYYL